jgi:hypothetical protein
VSKSFCGLLGFFARDARVLSKKQIDILSYFWLFFVPDYGQGLAIFPDASESRFYGYLFLLEFAILTVKRLFIL